MQFVINTEKILLTRVLAYACYLPMHIVIMSLHVMGFFLLQYVKKLLRISISFSKAESWGSVTLLKIGIFTFCEEGFCPKSTNILPTLS